MIIINFRSFVVVTLFSLALSIGVLAQTPNGLLGFGDAVDGTPATTANSGFGGVRVGSGGGGFTLANPGVTTALGSELRGVSSSSGSINSVGVTSAEFGTAADVFSVQFIMNLSGGSSGTWYFFAGNGASFGSAQSSGFTSAQVFTGVRFTFGAANAITTANRAAGNWVSFPASPFVQNTNYRVTIVGNNSAATVNYGTGQSVAPNTYDLWVNAMLVQNDVPKGELPAATTVNAFRFYGENSTGNVATIALDNVAWWNQAIDAAVVTSAGVTVGGRVADSTGRGLGRVNVTITGGSLTEPIRSMTNPFGYYRFEDLTVGATYIMTVNSKQYTFTPNSRIISLTDEATDLDFTADAPTGSLVPSIMKKR